MKTILLLAILLISILNSSFGQLTRLDSLHNALAGADDPSTKAGIMLQIGNIYASRNTDSATYYYHQVLHGQSDVRLRARAAIQLCATYRFVRPDSTFYYGNLALKLAFENDFKDIQPDIFVSLSITEYAIGNMPQALKFALQVVKLAEEINQPYDQAFGQDLKGNIYFKSGSYLKSISSHRQAFNGFYANKEFFGAGAALAAIGQSYAYLNQIDSALYYAQQAIDIFPGSGHFIEDILGSTFHKIGDHDKAIKYFKNSIQSPELYISFNGNLEIAEIYLAQNEPDSVLFYGKQALDIAIRSGFYSNIIKANTFLSRFFESSDPARGIKHAYEALAYKDSLATMERSMAIEGYLDVDSQQRQREIEEAKNEFRARIRTNTFLGSSFTLIVIAILLFWNNRQKQRSKKRIELAYERLKNTQSQLIQSEKMASLGELTAGIAHEIQNPLNFVNNFSEVNTELIAELKAESVKPKVEWDESLIKETLDNINDNEQKIVHHGKRADAIVKGMLQHSRTSIGVKEPTDINALADEYLRLAYHGFRAKDKSFNAKFETDFDSSLPKVNVVPQDIGRVVLNLINNAFYTVSEKQKEESRKAQSNYEPTVLVTTKSLGNKIEICVKDNGNGIPENIKEKIFQPFFTTKPTGQGTGLGLSLSYDIVKAHGGELLLETAKGKGSEFLIKIPIAL